MTNQARIQLNDLEANGAAGIKAGAGDIREIDWSKTYTPKPDPELKDPFK